MKKLAEAVEEEKRQKKVKKSVSIGTAGQQARRDVRGGVAPPAEEPSPGETSHAEREEDVAMLQDDDGNVAFMNEDTGEVTMAEDVTFLQDEQTFLQENEAIYLQDDMSTYLQDDNASIYPNYSVQYS